MDRLEKDQPISEEEREQMRVELGLPPKAPEPEEDNEDEVLKNIGVTREDLADPAAAIARGGLETFWKLQRVQHYRDAKALRRADEMLRARDADDEAQHSSDPKKRDSRHENDDSFEQKAPPWQALSGLYSETESSLAPDEREERIQTLISIVREMARKELAKDAARKNAWHTVNWDPVRAICFYLGIARSKLSSYCKEISGLALHEMVDSLRAKDIPKKMKAELRVFVKQRFLNCGLRNSDCGLGRMNSKFNNEQGAGARPANGRLAVAHAGKLTVAHDDEQGEGALVGKPPVAHGGKLTVAHDGEQGEGEVFEEALVLWNALKAARRAPDFSRAEWALGFGFPNYQRLYRTCLFAFRKTPGQMEFQILRELVQEILHRADAGETEILAPEPDESAKNSEMNGGGIISEMESARNGPGVDDLNRSIA